MGGIESSIAETQHLIIGEDRPLRWNVTDSAGSAQAMTGWTLEFNLLDQRGGTALVTKTPTIQNGNGTNDQAALTLTASDWTASGLDESGSRFYTLSRTDSGSVAVLAFGEVVVHNALATA